MKSTWARVIAGVIVIGLGSFVMSTEVGSAQWIVGLIIAVAGLGLIVWAVARRSHIGGSS